MNKKKMFAIVIAVIIFAGGGSFYGGMKYGQGIATTQRSQVARQFGANGGAVSVPGGRVSGGGQGFTSGEIIAKDDKSVTIQLRAGGSKIVFFSDITKIAKTTDGSSVDLQIGENATVAGNSNSDGSITANSIQLQPAVPFQQ